MTLATPTVGKFKGVIGEVIEVNGEEVSVDITINLNPYGIITLPPEQVKYVEPINHGLSIGDTVEHKHLGKGIVNRIFPNGMIVIELDKGHTVSCIYSSLIKYNIDDQIAKLEKERRAILAEGAIAPNGVWLEYGKVPKRKFRQAYYRSRQPTFTSKRGGLTYRQYIGEENSPATKLAEQAIARRNRLQKINKLLEKLNAN